MGGIIILTALSINFMFSKESTITDITFDNIDALAENESTDPKPTCIYVGTFCFGVDKNGIVGDAGGDRYGTEERTKRPDPRGGR